jgi:hypothetical protein
VNLPDFIEAHLHGLIEAWAEYALAISQERTLLSENQLRNSAADVLIAMAADVRSARSAGVIALDEMVPQCSPSVGAHQIQHDSVRRLMNFF